MRILLRVLALVLMVSGLLPFMATFFVATNQSMIIEMFQFNGPPSADLQVTFALLGSALMFASVIQFLAAAWVWKAKTEGLKLSIWVGVILVANGGYIFAVLSKTGMDDPSLYAPDLIKGAIILALTTIALDKMAKLPSTIYKG